MLLFNIVDVRTPNGVMFKMHRVQEFKSSCLCYYEDILECSENLGLSISVNIYLDFHCHEIPFVRSCPDIVFIQCHHL